MQLARKPSIRRALTTISAVLLGSSAVTAADGNKLESSILLYSETDRVQATEGVVGLTHAFSGDRILSGRLSFDALTGPSPNGATPSNNIQTFTRPSGAGSYTIQPGETPLDDTFRDTRVSLNGTYAMPLNRLTGLSLGRHVSSEHDYTSFGGNVGLTRDLNRRNTTLSLSAAFSHDLVRPEGGVPTPFAVMPSAVNDDSGDDDRDEEHQGVNETKNVFDAVLGVTQVLDHQTLLRLNYSFSHSSGYLNDPYKLLSVVQGRTGAQPGEPVEYLYESRPDSRSKHALFAEARRYLGGHTVDLSYRYFWDNWGVRSHTFDIRYRLPLGGGHAVQPHVRWYTQSAADFYSSYLIDNAVTPDHASADYRLAPFDAITLGLQYYLPVAPGIQFNVGGEYYYQAGDISPPASLGPLSDYDLFPDLKAFMIRAGVSYDL